MTEPRCWRCGRFTTTQMRVTVEQPGKPISVSDTCPRAECHEGIAFAEAIAELNHREAALPKKRVATNQ